MLNEIYGTLIREKIREHLNDSLQKEKIDIVILHVVSTSLGMGIAKYNKDKIMLFEDALRKSFEIVKSSNKKNFSFLTVIMFSYFIDDTKSRFVIHPFNVKYAIKSGFKPVVDHEKLSTDSIEIKI